MGQAGAEVEAKEGEEEEDERRRRTQITFTAITIYLTTYYVCLSITVLSPVSIAVPCLAVLLSFNLFVLVR